MDALKRDNYIDFLRGIAALSVVFIHTCFWSGYSYTPELMQTLSLAIDVPFFFFLSGWSSAYVDSFERSIRSLLNIYKKYVMFLPFFFLILLIFGFFIKQYPGLSLRSLYGNLFFIAEEPNALSGVMGSMWFMPVYLAVVPIGRLVTTKLMPSHTGGGGTSPSPLPFSVCFIPTGRGAFSICRQIPCFTCFSFSSALPVRISVSENLKQSCFSASWILPL